MAHTEECLTKMSVDPTLRLSSGDVKPYPAPPPTTMIKPLPHPQRPQPVPPAPGVNTATPQPASAQVNGTPIALPAQVKLAHLRISSNVNMRAGGNGPTSTQHATSPLSTPPSSAALNNSAESQVSPPRPDVDVKMASHGSPNGAPVPPEAISAAMASPTPPSKPLASNSNVNVPNLANGYHIPTMPGYPAVKGNYGHPGARPNGLSIQQMQSLQAMLPADGVNLALRQPGAYVMPNGAYPMQMPGGRPIQWPIASQHSPPIVNVAVDGSTSQPPAGSPGRASSANGMRAPQLSQGRPVANPQVLNANQAMATQAGSHIARLTPHSPTPHMLSPNIAAAQVNVHSSPTRTPQPAIPNPSPSLQSRQLVGGSGAAGY